MRVGENDYTAEVVVGTRNNGSMVLYDVLNLMPTSFNKKETATAISENPSPRAARNTATISDDSISQASGDVKGEYSISDNGYTDYDKPITVDDVRQLRDIIKAHGGERVSINDFTSEDIHAVQKWAYKMWNDFKANGVNPCISPFFRAWFGDWRMYDEKTKLRYIPVNTSQTSNGDVSRSGAVNFDTGWKIRVNTNGVEETANKNGKWSDAFHSLGSINDMLEVAVLVDTMVIDNPSGKMDKTAVFMHHFYCPVSVDGSNGIAKLYVTESTGSDHKFYLTKIEMESTDSIRQSKSSGINSSDDSNISIAYIYRFVKENNDKYEADSKNPSKFSPKEVNPILLNEDGTPKKFYHGTNSEDRFTVFNQRANPDKLNVNRIGAGNYFSPEMYQAERYAKSEHGKVYTSYLRLTNPYVLSASRLDAAEIIASDLGIELYDVRGDDGYIKIGNANLTEALKDAGYDGVILMKPGTDGKVIDEINVFDSENIKSATDNIGTFDGGNKDIQYSLSDPAQQKKVMNDLRNINPQKKQRIASPTILLFLISSCTARWPRSSPQAVRSHTSGRPAYRLHTAGAAVRQPTIRSTRRP